MGITAHFYAAKTNVDAFEAACRAHWPEEFERLQVSTVDGTSDDGSIKGSIEYVYDDVSFTFWQDGDYACLAESESGLGADADKLAALSAMFGVVLAAVIGDHGGYYEIALYENGTLLRRLSNSGHEGMPIPQEDGIDLSKFDDDDVATVWSSFGLTDFLNGVPPFRLLKFVAADEEAPSGRDPIPQEATPTVVHASKPWWKFW